MASAWGDSWGDAWGDSWDIVTVVAPDVNPIQLTDWPVPQRRRAEPTTFTHHAIWRKCSRRWQAVVNFYLPVAVDPITEEIQPEVTYELATRPVYFQQPTMGHGPGAVTVERLPGEVTAFKHYGQWMRNQRIWSARVRVVHNDDAEAIMLLMGSN